MQNENVPPSPANDAAMATLVAIAKEISLDSIHAIEPLVTRIDDVAVELEGDHFDGGIGDVNADVAMRLDYVALAATAPELGANYEARDVLVGATDEYVVHCESVLYSGGDSRMLVKFSVRTYKDPEHAQNAARALARALCIEQVASALAAVDELAAAIKNPDGTPAGQPIRDYIAQLQAL